MDDTVTLWNRHSTENYFLANQINLPVMVTSSSLECLQKPATESLTSY
jgi:hypothetical protein